MHARTYTVTQRRVAELVLERARTLIGCAPDDEAAIYGWVCGETQPSRIVLHYVWVKAFCRGQGVASRLLAEFLENAQDKPVVVSHISDKAKTIAYGKRAVARQVFCVQRPFLRYNPLLSHLPDSEVAL
jgi:ribosomal protein S18 acetylase RimI-like enzyme